MTYAGVGGRFSARNEGRRIAFGDPFVRLADGITYTAIFNPLSEMEVDEIVLEGITNVANLNPHSLDLIPLACPIADGDWIVWPATGSTAIDRFRVIKVNNGYLQGYHLWRSAVVISDPSISGTMAIVPVPVPSGIADFDFSVPANSMYISLL